MQNSKVKEPLDKIIAHLEEETRMILPGIQTLFGFQLIAVFNDRFSDLSSLAQMAHFVATLSSALAVLIVLIPAAYHRQAEPDSVSDRLCKLGTKCLTICLLPLCFGIAIDIFVIGELMRFNKVTSIIFSSVTFMALFSAWFIFPFVMKKTSAPKRC